VKLPGAEAAVVEPEKVRDYLLSPTHQVGRFKAAFFAALGHSQQNWADLEQDLRNLASGQEGVQVRDLWYTNGAVRHDENFPRFVTAMRGDKR